MKKSIRIAAALCAAVFALPVLAGCDFINGDKSKDGDEGENPFKGKTLVYEYVTGAGEHCRDSLEFLSGEAAVQTFGYWRTSPEDVISHRKELTYSLGSSNGKDFLCFAEALDGEEVKQFFVDYEGVSEATKRLLIEGATLFVYYVFAENGIIRINDHYYAGDIERGEMRFYTETADVHMSFWRHELIFNQRHEKKTYWGIPVFDGKKFTAEMYRGEGARITEIGEGPYTPVGTLKGHYDIPAMTTTGRCTGKIYFDAFPNEMEGLFEKSYAVESWDYWYGNIDNDVWEEWHVVTQ